MTKTTNYQLNQWAKSDRIMMTDFNADNQKLDAALAAKCEAVCGSYIGDILNVNPMHISLGFAPAAVLVFSANGSKHGLALPDLPQLDSSRNPVLTVSDDGFTVTSDFNGTVGTGDSPYRYIAFRRLG